MQCHWHESFGSGTTCGKGKVERGKSDFTLKKISSFIKLFQKQPFEGVLKKRCSENMQQIYRRTPMLKCDFNKVAKQLKMIKKFK